VISDHAGDSAARLADDAEAVQEILARAGERAVVEYVSAHDPVNLLAVDGFEQMIARFTTDIPYLSNWGQPLLIGPGSILVANTENERIAKRELAEAVDIYVELVKSLLAQSSK
jgi:acetylornithine deacetylase